MILNMNLLFSEGQAITATAISDNVLQFLDTGTVPRESGAIDRNLGRGTYIPMLLQVTEDFATLTSLTVTVETADNAALSSGAAVLATTGAIPVASLKAGYRFPSPLVLPDATLKEHLGLRYTVGGSNATAGKITAALATEVQQA